ncbi:hypothetical protein [Haloferula sp. BvORR071]|uniref:hypothetical protein n=1 Tax=Haloferula sp. BvORR071 TaxID=1396141 RepID=UPI00055457FB|nr:hypothetical protein [Haloferula sp. BvORR071]
MILRSLAVSAFLLGSALAADPIFSGQQPGEKTTPFKIVEILGANAGKEREVIADNGGGATALVFMHGIERSMMPLLRVVDEYGALRKDSLKTEIIFLNADRLEGEQRAKNASGSLKLQSRVGLSLDGAEGPGNYGLNKECLMTIIVAKDNTVTANFALAQPGIADAPKVLEALAKVSGDANPPTLEQLNERQMARNGGGPRDGGGMRRGEGMAPPARPPVDLNQFDLNTEEGLRGAVKALIGEVQSLRTELATRPPQRPGPRPEPQPARAPIPGAVPSDPKLEGLVRRFIRPTNDDAAVDAVLAEVRDYIKDNADLKQQAIDGWTRVLHFENYGTEYARKTGKAFLEELKK